MKIDLKKERFESIEKAFVDLKAGKNKSMALATIRRNLKATFGKDIDCVIIENKNKDNFFIMSVYPDQSTIDEVVEAVVSEKPDEVIRKIWNDAYKWTVEIDSRILDGSIIDVTAKELTAFLLHEMGHVVYSNSIPKRISKVMRLEYARASIEVKKLLEDKLFRQILRLPIIHSCLYDNYKTKSNIKNELKADVFVVKMGYGEDLESALNKLIILSDHKKVGDINKESQEVYSDMKSMTLFSLRTVEHFKDRKASVVKQNLKKLLFSSPSQFVQKSIGEIEDTFIKSVEETSVTESVKMEYFENKANKIVDEFFMEFVNFGNRKLKRIDPAELDYIQLEKNNIKTNDDKMLLISYIYSKLDTVKYYISLIDSRSSKYTVPHSRDELENMAARLEKLKDEVLETRIKEVKYGLFVQYPEDYEG